MFELALLALIAGIIVTVYFSRPKKKLPPSPVGYPVIGHLHLLKEPFHRTLNDISKTLGDVFLLKLGSRKAVIATSASAAEEFLTHQNDTVFANRPATTLGVYAGYNNTILTSVSYGEHWRKLRRFCTLNVFSTVRIRDSLEIRRDEVRALLKTIHVVNTEKLELRPLLSGLMFNILMRMVAGKRYYGVEDEEAKEVLELIEETFLFSGVSYIGDFLPVMKMFDFDGYIKRGKRLGSKLDEFMQKLVDAKRRNRGNTETMIDRLLSLQESEPTFYTDDIIKGLVEVMLLAGTDTTGVTLEWAMANLLNHPEILKKVKKELNDVVSVEERLMEESDVGKCTYLNNVICETLRLYPAAPLLVPHQSSVDCKVAGYDIPRGSWLLVNAWAIQRDPKVWDDPEAFKPERFEGETHRGGKFIPFGMGRRACPGMGLSQLLMGLALGSLIQCFDWEKVDDMEVDMLEGRGISMPKVVPLVAKCKSSPLLNKLVL